MKKYKLIINGEKYETKILEYKGSYAKVSVNGIDYEIDIEKDGIQAKESVAKQTASTSSAPVISKPSQVKSIKAEPPKPGVIRAPIPGTILDIKVKVNDIVTEDDVVLILEAMKMESEIHAGINGTVKAINISKGDSVQENDILIEIGVV